MISELRRKFREIQDTKTSKKALDKIINMLDSIIYENLTDKSFYKGDLPINPFKDGNVFGDRKQLNTKNYIDFLSSKNGNLVSIKDNEGKVLFAFADQRKIGKIVHDFNTTNVDILNSIIEILTPHINKDFNLEENIKKNESLKKRRDNILELIKINLKNASLEEKDFKNLTLSIKNRNIIKEVFIYEKNNEKPILRVEVKERKMEHKLIFFNFDKIKELEEFLIKEKKNYKNKIRP